MSEIEKEPMPIVLYVILASSFAWIPLLFLELIDRLKYPSLGLALLIHFLLGAYLLIASISVFRSGRKSSWVFTALNCLVLALDVFCFIMVALAISGRLPFGGGRYQ